MFDMQTLMLISIHALHEESDYVMDVETFIEHAISIHALHEESDARHHESRLPCDDFNPRSP